LGIMECCEKETFLKVGGQGWGRTLQIGVWTGIIGDGIGFDIMWGMVRGFLAILVMTMVGCASKAPQQAALPATQPHWEPAAASALVFTPPVAIDEPELALPGLGGLRGHLWGLIRWRPPIIMFASKTARPATVTMATAGGRSVCRSGCRGGRPRKPMGSIIIASFHLNFLASAIILY